MTLPRDPRARSERRIEFLGEQDGAGERDLKADLRIVFSHYPRVERAYLAQIGFAPHAVPAVALCLVPKAAEDPMLIDDVGLAFHRLFSSDNHMDILFASEEQETDLRRVCRPFFDLGVAG